MNLQKLIDKYDYKYIHPDFKIGKPSKELPEIEFVYFGKYLSDAEVKEQMGQKGFDLVSFEDLLVYLDKNPQILDEKKYIGSVLPDDLFIAFFGWRGERYVDVDRHSGGWGDGWRFAGIKKQMTNGNGEDLKKKIIGRKETDKNDCWNWSGAKRKGYGMIKVGMKQMSVHRVLYEILVAPIPEGYVIDHLCRNKSCINPAHLQPVTSKENTLRGTSFAAINSKKTHCPKGHEYTQENLGKNKAGRRVCKQCNRDRMKSRVPRVNVN